MPRRPSDAKIRRLARQQKSYDLFDRGFSNVMVCDAIGIAPNTATKYRRLWEEDRQIQHAETAHKLNDLAGNTIDAIRENEQIRQAAWDEYETARSDVSVKCPHCGESSTLSYASATVRNSMLNTVIKAQEIRAKLFGVMGVKQEFIVMMNTVKKVQDLLLTFMARELCDEDRRKLDTYMNAPELASYFGMPDLSIEASSSETVRA